jgi:hypothetical protein
MEPSTKKRPSKKKSGVDTGDLLVTSDQPKENISIVIEEKEPETLLKEKLVDEDAAALKKRGRKPKGGKLISRNIDDSNKPTQVVNVILHLKCSSKDLDTYTTTMNKMVTDPLNYNPDVPPEIMTYNNETQNSYSVYQDPDKKNELDYAYSEPMNKRKDSNSSNAQCCSKCSSSIEEKTPDETDDVNIKDLNQKLKRLKINLYKNAMNDKKSACFWCTYDFDNETCYIPKYEMDGKLYGYGSFCRPECAVAYLMKENIDDSTKFERYHLLNQIYSKVYHFKKNIKPAPNPYFLLDKFFGNMTIQEYRKLLKTEHMLLVIDKPLTRILPELHEDTDDFIMGVYGGSKGSATQAGGVYKVKRQSEKQQGPTKSSIMRDKFGMTQH